MDIAALSTNLSMAQTMQAVEVSVLKKAMDFEGSAALKLIESMPPAPSFGHLMDLRA